MKKFLVIHNRISGIAYARRVWELVLSIKGNGDISIRELPIHITDQPAWKAAIAAEKGL
jgi:hypothetical protein